MLQKVQCLKISKTHVKPLTVVVLKEKNFLSLALSLQSLSVCFSQCWDSWLQINLWGLRQFSRLSLPRFWECWTVSPLCPKSTSVPFGSQSPNCTWACETKSSVERRSLWSQDWVLLKYTVWNVMRQPALLQGGNAFLFTILPDES